MNKNFVVAVPSNHLANEYTWKQVSGYSVWNVTVDAVNGTLVSVRLRDVNVNSPSEKARQNYRDLHGVGLI